MEKAEISKEKNLGKGQKILIAFVCAFVAAVLMFGIVFGIIIGVQKASAVCEYNGVTVDKDTAFYLASYYKYNFIASLRAADIEAYDSLDFWQSKDTDGTAYGTHLVLGVKNYIADILVANYYYNRYATLDSQDKTKINSAVDALISRFSSAEKLDEALALCKTDKKALKKAAELLYKANYAKTVIYGASGEKLVNYPDECQRYLGEYSRVRLLFIRTEDVFVRDDNGNYVISGGEYERRELTAEEKAEREALIAKIDAEIEGYKTGGDIQITEELFNSYLSNYGEGEKDKNSSGYYFSKSSVYSAAFAEDVSLEIVKTALNMEIGEYGKVTTDFAVCYIYRLEVEEGAYADTSENGFFADFYADASDFLFADMLKTMRDEVDFSKWLSSEDVVGLSYDSDIYVRF